MLQPGDVIGLPNDRLAVVWSIGSATLSLLPIVSADGQRPDPQDVFVSGTGRAIRARRFAWPNQQQQPIAHVSDETMSRIEIALQLRSEQAAAGRRGTGQHGDIGRTAPPGPPYARRFHQAYLSSCDGPDAARTTTPDRPS